MQYILHNRRGFLTAAAAIILATTAGSGFAQDLPPIEGITPAQVAAAEKEGEINLYTGTWKDAQDAVIAGFSKRFPNIKVNTFAAPASQLQEKFESELNAGRGVADIFQISSPGDLNNEAAKGYLMSYVSTQDAAYADNVKGKDGYWYPIRVALSGIAWNTDGVSEEEAASIHSVKDLTDPKWKGRLGVTDPQIGGVPALPFYLWLNDPELGEPFLKALAANEPKVYAGTNPASQALASGDIDVLVNAGETGLVPLLADGAPLQWKFENPASFMVTGQAISAKAPHPNAAKLYQDYSLSEEGAALFQKWAGTPARTGLTDERDVAKLPWYKPPEALATFDPNKFTDSLKDLIATYKAAFGNR